MAFLEQTPDRTSRLVLADIEAKSVMGLSPDGKSVKAFDVCDSMNYAYVLASEGLAERALAEHRKAAVIFTGRPLVDAIFAPDRYSQTGEQMGTDRGELWAVLDGRTNQVTHPDGTPVTLFEAGERNFALSPDGSSLVTALPFPEIPLAWESRYAPPYPAFPYRLRAGKQDLSAFRGFFISEYVRIDFRTGAIESLTGAPLGDGAGWFAATELSPRWSQDGEGILLPGTFWEGDSHAPARPCGALYIEVRSRRSSCVEWLKASLINGYEEAFHFLSDLRFEGKDTSRVVVGFHTPDGQRGTTAYRQSPDRRWLIDGRTAVELPRQPSADLEAAVKEDLNEPPVLMIGKAGSKRLRTLWDPNPQLKDVDLGTAVVYKWKDSAGRPWTGGLYRPPGYELGRSYPLVIQTHGFAEHEFRPSGVFPTAMAARALAGAGILVLQVGEDACQLANTEEGSCSADGYESAVKQLHAERLVDLDRVGIIGFSRTCYSVMHLLTTGSLKISAASVTDGVMDDYLQYLHAVDFESDAMNHDFEATIGAQPFGTGLQIWQERSPLFNIQRVNAALLVVGEGEPSLLGMWGPYAALRLLKKPTELVLLNTDEHVLTNPGMRVASQGGTVDWFQFWLKGFEDPDPDKADQYRRWEQLCDMQAAQNPKQLAFCVRTRAN
jgi:dipeptidyl aminopeptidase/acylaminoacyl peptidase